ncbi:NAD(P)-dependent oxidoreductase [Olivibacter domesticus]|uniref:D-3-phosphoglycerate dehydrogenase n=1 Tax=Olivibacter domesticus TaxID=407022 RepID=A0A1H7ZRI3_OLID1|nr:NAD(P)-dependent oxidoreductase [Olivibacter domesticus]SEM60109.1 D-3-phosphoglycerate dehydrogenase [Olivibacter domesticus]
MMNNRELPGNIKILIVDDLHPVFLEKLDEMGLHYVYQPNIDRSGALKIIEDYEVLVIRSKFKVDQALLDQAKRLKYIARAGAGMDNIDEDLALTKGIHLLNAPEGNRDAVGEHLIGMLFSLLNNLLRADKQVRNGEWFREMNRGVELGGKTVALIGYGNNGRAMAKKLSGFDVKVIAYDKYKTGFSDEYAQEVSMEQIVKGADVLSLHIPLTRETRYLVNKEYLFHFRKPIFFLNGARGEIVDIEAVLEAIQNGRILGAGFDVLPIEKFPDLNGTTWFNRLVEHDRVILSPHVAGWTTESYFKIAAILADKLIASLQS